MKRKILFLVNHDVVIYNFRKELIIELLAKGCEVYISSPHGPKIRYLEDMGCHYIETDVSRRGTSLMEDTKLYRMYLRILKEIRPDLVLTYTIKPNIYGNIACRMMKIPCISTITGLGSSLVNEGVIKRITTTLYSIAFKKCQCVFFQNEDNAEFFYTNKIRMLKSIVVKGSGVNVDQFSYLEYPKDENNLQILYVGRIMKDKGINELLEAIQKLKRDNTAITFNFVGFFDDDFSDIVTKLSNEKVINYYGQQESTKQYLKESAAVILPSYHEGMSNALLEAASSGRPVLASNISGCREIVDDMVTGILFEPRDTNSIYDALQEFISLTHAQREEMGRLGREKVLIEFNRSDVIDEYLKEISLTLNLKGDYCDKT